MAKPITFSQLSKALCELGFRSSRVHGSHHLFRHEPTDTVILLPLLKQHEAVAPQDVISARLVIAGRGVASASHFNELLGANGQRNSNGQPVTS